MKQILIILLLGIGNNLDAQLDPGMIAPALNLSKTYTTGNELTTDNLKGKILVLDFWATWCTPCVAAMPGNNSLYEKYRDKGVVFIGITDEKEEVIEAFLNRVSIKFPIGISNGEDFENYKVTPRPQMYIVNRNGVIVYQGRRINDEILNQVVTTNGVQVKKQPVSAPNENLILNGGFAPGEDPLYNGVRAMMGKGRPDRNEIFNQFIIRPALDTSFNGCGYSFYHGRVGFTYSCGTIKEILAYIMDLPSDIRIENVTGYDNLYDLVYKQKIDRPEDARKEIIEKILVTFDVKIDAVEKQREVNVLYQKTVHKDVLDEEKLKPSTRRAYLKTSFFSTLLEELTSDYYLVDNELEQKAIYALNEHKMTLDDFYRTDNAAEIIDFLKSVGIEVRQEKRKLLTYKIRSL